MSKLNRGTIQAWLPTIVGIIIVLLIGGGILAWQYMKTTEKIEEQSINILSPNGGEIWIEGNTYNIAWNSSGIEKVGLEAASDGKDLGHFAFGVDAKSGVYSWKIPDGFISGFGISKSDHMKVRVFDEKNSSIYDENDNYFTIVARDETSDWKTYRSEEYGFEIKYPIGTKMGDIDITGGREVWIQLPFSLGETKLTSKVLHIRMVTTQFNRGIEQPASCTKTSDTQYIVINGVSFNKNDISSEFWGTESAAVAIEYCTMKGNKAFKIVSELGYSRYSQLPDFNIEKELEVFKKMLSAFKFLE